MYRKSWQWGLFGLVWLVVPGGIEPIEARPVPDGTLGGERSTVTEGTIRGIPSDRIGGGATRGQNLFHSFESFNVEAGRGVYFDNPAGIENIFSRVTGGSRSDINGRLGVIQAGSGDVLGSANLFFMNPNGIVFGPGAQLDVGGSFVGTTANAIGFGDVGFFSATNPELPSQLLTINPSAFLFNQVNTAPIQAVGTPPGSGTVTTLQVPIGRSLVLLGGDVSLNATNVFAPGGRVELGGLRGAGTIGLASVGNALELGFSDQVARTDVSITNQAGVNVISNGGGSVAINARNVEVSRNSGIFSGINLGSTATTPAGDVDIDATGTLTLSDTGFIANAVLGIGDSGDVNISAQSVNLLNAGGIATASVGRGNIGNVTIEADTISLSGRNESNTSSGILSSIASIPRFVGSGEGGDVRLQARRISLSDGAFIATSNLAAEAVAQGSVGNIEVSATESLEMRGGAIFRTDTSGQANAGSISIDSRGTVSLGNGSRLVSESNGQGDAGNILIQADSSVSFDGVNANGVPSGIGSSINPVRASETASTRRAGDITIDTGALSMTNGAILFGNVEAGATGQGGNININADSVLMTSGSQIQSILRGSTTTVDGTNVAGARGRTGNVEVTADRSFIARGRSLQGLGSGIFTIAGTGTEGDAGNITLRARLDSITLENGALITSATGAQGNGGSITLDAPSITLIDDVLISAETFGRGFAGDITITGNQLIARSGGQISSGSGREGFSGDFGRGGNIAVTVADLIELDGDGFFNRSGIFSETSSSNRAGDIDLSVRQLIVSNGAAVASGASGSGSLGGDGGNITLNVNDSIEVIGVGNRPSAITTEANPISGTERVSNAGSLNISTGRLILRNGGIVQTVATVEPLNNQDTPTGRANAGNIIIRAGESVLIENSTNRQTGIFSNLDSNVIGNAGNITITADFVSLTSNNSPDSRVDISSQTLGQGNSGSITLQVNGDIFLERQGYIFSQVSNGGQGDAGDIDIIARSLSLVGGAEIASSIFREEDGIPGGQGERAGNIRINTTDFISADGIGITGFSSGIFANTQRGARGRGGDLDITTGRLRIANGAVITAQTLNDSDSGNIRINADSLEMFDGGQVVANTNGGSGDAGDISLNVRNIILSGFDPNYNNRFVQFPEAPVANTSERSGIFATTEIGSTGNSGDITIETDSISLDNLAQISASTSGIGTAGGIRVREAEAISLNNASITTAVNSSAVLAFPTNRSNIDLQTQSLSLSDGAEITASTSGQGSAGTVTVRDASTIDLNNSNISSTANLGAIGDGGSIILDTNSLNLDRANIIASTQGQGRAGNIIVQDADQVSLDQNSTISTAVGETGIGQGGNITLNTNSLNLTDRSEITSNTSGQGNAGNIRIQGAETVTLNNDSAVTTAVRRGADGNGGDIEIETDRLRLDDSVISSSTAGTGSTGRVTVNASDRITLRNQSRIDNRVEQGAIGDSRTIRLETDSLRLDSSQITASTNGRGRAGDIAISNANTIDLDDNSTISSAVRQNGRGRAGSVTVRNAQTLSLNNGSGISTAVNQGGRGRGGNIQIDTNALTLDNNAVINAQTRGRGRAGDITIDTNQIEATQGGRLTSSTNTNRPAGTITLRALDRITLNGSNSRISANTTRSGRGGRIDLQTQQLDLNNGAMISSTSQGSGTAGNIRITASELLQSAGGNITTRANRSTGGDITLTGGDIDLSRGSSIRTDVDRGSGNGGDIAINADTVRLQDNSDIQTRVGETGTGDGGNITITADSVIAFDDSDLITEAPNLGGDITLNTPVFFGAGYQANVSTADNPDGNGRVDLDASGEVSAGAVQTPDTSFIQNSLSDLPDSAIDTEALLANSCIARTENSGTFLITGSGGLPPNRPGIAPLSPYPTETVRSTPEESSWQPGDPIVEPQGVYRLPNGELVMMHECSQS